MLRVKTFTAPSAIHGTGLFADEDIPKGATIWSFEEGFDHEWTHEKFEKLSEEQKTEWKKYGYRSVYTGNWVLAADNERYINRSESPNVVENLVSSDREKPTIIARDIPKGEELVCDYRECYANFAEHAKQNGIQVTTSKTY